jgi:hypothetical protein
MWTSTLQKLLLHLPQAHTIYFLLSSAPIFNGKMDGSCADTTQNKVTQMEMQYLLLVEQSDFT